MSAPARRLSRRAFTASFAGATLLGACHRSHAAEGLSKPVDAGGPSPGSPAPAPGSRGASRLVEWSFDGSVSTRTALLVPTWGGDAARFPVLVALHGRGEARKPPAEGALGWPRDYALARAIDRVANPPLTATDFEGYVEGSRLERLNHALVANPFGGLIVACPYVPDLELTDDDAVARFGHFVTEVLLPRVRRELPARAEPAATGIDGVSLGGAVALGVGFDQPMAFGAVGSLQPALDVKDRGRWADRAEAARKLNPGLAIRLLTSDGDYFRDAVRATSAAFDAKSILHDFERVVGPHDYPFNRGPGSIELLLWHDRVLRRG